MKLSRAVAGIVSAVMLVFTVSPSFSPSAIAEEESQELQESGILSNDVTIKATNSFGNMFASELTAKEAEQIENNGCNIFSVEMDGNEASVSYQTVVDCTLVVGIYDDSGTTLCATGATEVTAEETETTLTIETDEMPSYYYIKGYLADTDTLEPLCTVYDCPNYTQEMQEFFAKTVDDFDEEKVINFDDDRTNNFAVYSDNTIVIPQNEGHNNVTTADDENSLYVIENADENILALQPGDTFSYQYGETGLLIVKIDTISVDGTTATITGSDSELDEVFDYVRIETSQDMDSAEIEPLNGAEVTEVTEEDTEISIESAGGIHAKSASTKLSKEVKKNFVDWQPFKGSTDTQGDTFPSFSGEFKVNGSVSFKASVDMEFYVTLRQSYISLQISYRGGVDLKISAKGQLTYPLCNMGFSPVPGVYIGLTPSFIIRMTADITLSGDWSGSFGMSADSRTKKIKDISKKPTYSLSAKAEGKCFVGFDLQPKITLVSKKICKVSTTLEAGIEINATLSKSLTSETETDVEKIKRIHDCKACVDGDINFAFSMKFEVKLPLLSKLELNLLDEKYKIGDFYWSIDRDEFGLTECPHQIQRVTLKVQDSAGEPVSGAELSFSSDTEVKTMELPYLPEKLTGTLTTDENGEVSVFLGMGKTKVTASKEGYGVTEKSFKTNISKLNIFRLNDEIRTDGIIVLPAPRHTFKVTVTDANGKHVRYAKLSCNDQTTPEYTNSDGQAAMRLPDGDYTFTLEKDGEEETFAVAIRGEDTETEIVLGGEQSEPGETEPAVADVKNRLSMGDDHSAYITEDGSLYMWGDNGSGQLGDGTGVNKSTPVKIMDNVVSVSLGGDHSAAITTDGSLYTWGENGYGQLGDGTTEDKLEPTKIMDNVAAVSLEYRPSAAITADGSLYTWGCNEYGQFGDGTTEDKLEPTKIMDNVASVSLGWYHSAAITTDGSLYTWGDNYYGQLGDGTHEDKSIPVKIMDNVASVSLGGYHSAAITTDGSLYTWGFNWWGQLGDGTMESKLTPVKIMDNVAAVSLGGGNSAAITTDGSLYMWGSNAYGMLGDGTTEGKLTPVKIMDDVVSVSLGGGAHRAAITTDGSLYTWGDNDYGQLGDGTTEDKLVPTKINIPAGEPQTAALTYNSAEILEDEPETTTLTDLLPDTVYNYYVLCTDKGEKLLTPANIQYIAQFATDETGTAEVETGLTEISEDSVRIAIPAENVPEVNCGDVDMDGMVDASDASQILGIYATYSTGGTPEETEQQLLSADVNSDSMVDASDASTVLAYYAYLSTGGTVGIETFMVTE